MKNVLNLRWLVLPLMLMILAAGNVRADVSDLSISAPIAADSIAEAQDLTQEALSWHTQFNQFVDDYRFELGILASVFAAIIVLFLFFVVFRPRLEILPKVAYYEVHEKKLPLKHCQIAIKNKGFSSCNDIRVEISKHLLSDYDEETRVQLEKQKYLSIEGRFGSDAHSTINVEFNIEPLVIKNSKGNNEKIYFPRRIIVEVLAQNALSGIITPTRRVFTTEDFSVGRYVNTILVEQGDTYKQAIMKPNMKHLKKASISLASLWILASIGLMMSSMLLSIKLGLSLLLLVLFAVGILLWQLKVYTKAEAYTMSNIAHIVKATIIELHEHKHFNSGIVKKTDVEDIEPTSEEPESNDQKH